MHAALDIARCVDWQKVPAYSSRIDGILQQLMQSAFYTLFLHEQFHHKVESLGLRLLITTGSDRYRPYKQNIYRPAWGTVDWIEESLANAESYRRLSEPRYSNRIEAPIMAGLRRYLRRSIAAQPQRLKAALRHIPQSRAPNLGAFHLDAGGFVFAEAPKWAGSRQKTMALSGPMNAKIPLISEGFNDVSGCRWTESWSG